MADVLGVDPELDAQRLQTAEHPLVVLGDGREAGATLLTLTIVVSPAES